MKILKKLKKMFVSFENMLSGEHSCISCSKEILDGSDFQLCEKCLKSLDEIDGSTCTKCGEKLGEGNMLCEYCKDFDYAFDSNKSICYYTDVSSKIVKSLKYGGRKYYAKHIAKLMTRDKSCFENIDVITFVPASKKRLRTRGFNQAEEIANEISKIVNIPVVSLLEKVVEHKHQAGLTQKERLENLKDTFSVCSENKDKIKGKKILIVDDVFTTGATASEIAKLLKKNGAKYVFVATLAKR